MLVKLMKLDLVKIDQHLTDGFSFGELLSWLLFAPMPKRPCGWLSMRFLVCGENQRLDNW